MNLRITGLNIEATEAIKAYIEKKIGSLEKITEQIESADVEFRRVSNRQNKNTFQVVVNFEMRQEVLHVEQTEDDLYTAIDCAREEMESQIRKREGRFEDKKRNAGKVRRAFKSIFGIKE